MGAETPMPADARFVVRFQDATTHLRELVYIEGDNEQVVAVEPQGADPDVFDWIAGSAAGFHRRTITYEGRVLDDIQ